MNDLRALCEQYQSNPTTELRLELLEQLLAEQRRTTEIGRLAGGRQYLASESRNVSKALSRMLLIGDTLTQSPTTRLADARARLALVG